MNFLQWSCGWFELYASIYLHVKRDNFFEAVVRIVIGSSSVKFQKRNVPKSAYSNDKQLPKR